MEGTGSSAPRLLAVVRILHRRLAEGAYPAGSALPSESALARELGVARGTLRRALEQLESEHFLVCQRGSHWIAQEPTRSQSVSVLRSFAQWARSLGLEPSGRTVSSRAGRASAQEARELGLRRADRVHRIVRVRGLDGRPVMVERTTFPGWLAVTIAALPPDAPSIMAAVLAEHGVGLGHAEHRIFAMGAATVDSRLLQVPRSVPLLRVLRTARLADGRPFEYSDDRYIGGSIALSVVSSAAAVETGMPR